ncbi:MAG TPA: DUF4407 domain-containing protein [Thermoanaerobaculia bacterium]|nr:DUF4407 domain-containing protein [Thermoanaerobaculia bacterium]
MTDPVGTDMPSIESPTSPAQTPFELRPPHPFARFLWWCAGAVPELVESSPTERSKLAGIGGAVLATGVLAALSGGYALSFAFSGDPWAPLWGALFGIVWGLALFNLDRFLVATMKKRGRPGIKAFLVELTPALPRFLLAAGIGICLAKPLELRLFSGEIAEQMQLDRDRAVAQKLRASEAIEAPDVRRVETEIGRLEAKLQEAGRSAAAREDDFVRETDGTGGTGRVGVAEVAEVKRQARDAARAELSRLRAEIEPQIADRRARLAAARTRLDQGRQTFESAVATGLLARLDALANLEAAKPPVARASLFLTLLLAFFECAPVLVKLLAPRGPYDARLDLIAEREVAEAEREKEYLVDRERRWIDQATREENAFEQEFFTRIGPARLDRLDRRIDEWRSGPESYRTLEESVRDRLARVSRPLPRPGPST